MRPLLIFVKHNRYLWYDMIWYDMIYDMIWYNMIWYDNYDVMWYDMIWYDIWYDMIWYDYNLNIIAPSYTHMYIYIYIYIRLFCFSASSVCLRCANWVNVLSSEDLMTVRYGERTSYGDVYVQWPDITGLRMIPWGYIAGSRGIKGLHSTFMANL